MSGNTTKLWVNAYESDRFLLFKLLFNVVRVGFPDAVLQGIFHADRSNIPQS